MKIAENKNDIIDIRKASIKIDESIEKIPINALRTISINPSEMCNRKCHFCPRADPEVYPNQKLFISPKTIASLSKQLKRINYTGTVIWSGNGEPMMTPNLLEMTKKLREENPQIKEQQINTNGDYLKPKKIQELYDNGFDNIVVSLYDGPEQLEKTKKKFEGFDKDKYVLRISYYHSDNFEHFSSRAGAIKMNIEENKSHFKNKCFWPFYKMVLDWDGGVLLCCEDWFKLSRKNKKNTFNINTDTIEEIWNSEYLNEYRSYLKVGNRSKTVCNKCNINGEKIGGQFVEYFDV